jgi:tRNA (adenine37-N6)-methyltransferase
MNEIKIKPIAFVRNHQQDLSDENWSSIESYIEIVNDLPDECLDGIEEFSHLEIIFHFHKSKKEITGSEHPRENPKFPKSGIFAQRKKDRPNHLGSTIVKLIEKQGRKLKVQNLDAVNGSPIIDIKPVFLEYLPNEKVKQPDWVKELMTNYW